MPITHLLKTLGRATLLCAAFSAAPALADDFADIAKLSDATIAANTACLVGLAKKLGRQPNDAELNGFSADCMTQRAMVAKPDQAADGSISVVATLGSLTAEGAIDSGFSFTMICKDKETYAFLQSDTKFVSKTPKMELWYASNPATKWTWDADEDSFYVIGEAAATMMQSLSQNTSDVLVMATTDETTKEHHFTLTTIGPAVGAVATACGHK